MSKKIGIRFPGVTGRHIETDAHADFGSVDGMSAIIRLRDDDWATGANRGWISAWTTTGWRWIYLTSTGQQYFGWYGAATSQYELGAVDMGDQDPDLIYWLGVSVDVTNDVIKFWHGGTGNTPTWTLDREVAVAGAKGLDLTPAAAVAPAVGAMSATGSNPHLGEVFYAAVYDGVGDHTAPGLGTLVGELKPEHFGTNGFRDSTGKNWVQDPAATDLSTVIVN